jgi:hypothetical protein
LRNKEPGHAQYLRPVGFSVIDSVWKSEILAGAENFALYMAVIHKEKGGTQVSRPLETSFIVLLYGFFCNRGHKSYYSIFFAVK